MRKIAGEDKVYIALCALRNGEELHCDHEVRDLSWRKLKGIATLPSITCLRDLCHT